MLRQGTLLMADVLTRYLPIQASVSSILKFTNLPFLAQTCAIAPRYMRIAGDGQTRRKDVAESQAMLAS